MPILLLRRGPTPHFLRRTKINFELYMAASIPILILYEHERHCGCTNMNCFNLCHRHAGGQLPSGGREYSESHTDFAVRSGIDTRLSIYMLFRARDALRWLYEWELLQCVRYMQLPTGGRKRVPQITY
jgi:hypothetical protein